MAKMEHLGIEFPNLIKFFFEMLMCLLLCDSCYSTQRNVFIESAPLITGEYNVILKHCENMTREVHVGQLQVTSSPYFLGASKCRCIHQWSKVRRYTFRVSGIVTSWETSLLIYPSGLSIPRLRWKGIRAGSCSPPDKSG